MKHLLIAMTIFGSLAHASGTSRILETETKEVILTNPPKMLCTPGRGGSHYPTSSSLILKNIDLFPNTGLTLVYDDFPILGDHCAELNQQFSSQLPAKLTVTRTVTETCWRDDSGRDNSAHKIQWQSLSGEVGGFTFGSGAEILSNVYVENGTCP